jgi:DNA-directed RNA polymerase specialized sigma24 family protein
MHRALQRLRTLLDTMPRPMREVWLSHVVEGEPCSAVAATLQVPIGTVKSRLRRAWSAVLECG